MANKGLQGIVIDRDGARVKVRVFRNNTCENCNCVLQEACDPDEPLRGRRGLFDIFSDRSVLEIEAMNTARASVGDRCVIKLKSEKSLVKGAFMMYLLPGILFLVGLFAGGQLAKLWGLQGDAQILAQLGGGLALVVANYVGVKLFLILKGSGEYVPEVTQIVKRA